MEFKIGQSATITKKITNDDVKSFADLVGDYNPVHLDDTYAKNSIFGKKIVHGMFGASLISAVIGMKLPGPGAIYLSQSLNFNKPVYIDDTIEAKVTVMDVKEKKNKLILTLNTICKNSSDEVVIDGQAVMLVSIN